jgi:hypothetical protein
MDTARCSRTSHEPIGNKIPPTSIQRLSARNCPKPIYLTKKSNNPNIQDRNDFTIIAQHFI